MNVSAWSIRNPIPAVLLFILLTLLGLYAFSNMKVQQFMDLDLPTVTVSASLPGAAPAQMETEVARKIENSVATLQGIKHIYTKVQDGSAIVTVEFRLEKPTQEAVDDVRDAVSRIRSDLPADLKDPVVSKVNLSGSPILTYTVASSRMDDEALSWFVDNTVSKALLSARGVGAVSRVGGVTREIRIELDPARMLALNATAAGWLTAIWIGLAFKGLPVYILLPFEIIAGSLAGALVAGIAGWLRAYFGTNEVISTIMLNYIVLYLCQYLHQDVMSKSLRVDTDTTKTIGASGSLRIPWLSEMFGDSRISGGIFLAIIALVIFWFLMKKTTVGFEIKAVGLNPFASRYAGMSDKKNIIISMLLSGAFCGLGGVVQGLGTYQNYFTQTTTLDIGWDGMSVALLGGMSAIGILLASLLFSILKIGGLGMQTAAGIPFEIVSIVIAAIIFFVAISWAVGLLFKEKKSDKTATYIATAETAGRQAANDQQKGGEA